MTFLDYHPRLFHLAAARRWRIFYLGGEPGVADEAARQLRRTHPGLELACQHGYLRSGEDNAEALDRIRAFKPHCVLVGMGMPLQEAWLEENARHFEYTAFVAVGAAFDYLAGKIPTPGRWLGVFGLEWLARLLTEPRRLYYRYLIEPWSLVPHAVRDILISRQIFGENRVDAS